MDTKNSSNAIFTENWLINLYPYIHIYIYRWEQCMYRGCLSNNPKHLGNFRTRSAIYETMLRSLYSRWNKPLGTFSVMLATLKDYNSNGSVIRAEAYITLFRYNLNGLRRENLILPTIRKFSASSLIKSINCNIIDWPGNFEGNR